MSISTRLCYVCTLLMIWLGCYCQGICAMEHVSLVFDTIEPEAQIAKQYRVVSDLRASASGQFSGDEFCRLLVAIPANKSQIWIVDLRQESHGFIDGIPVSWYKNKNTVNLGKAAAKIKKEEDKLLFELGKQRAVTVFHLNKFASGAIGIERPTTMIPESVETEQHLVTSHGANYKRIYVLDHNKPDDREVDQFVNLVAKVKSNEWLHFHCRGGKGRSSTFIVMYDIIRNAHRWSYKQIIARQNKLGSIKLDSIPVKEEKLWKASSIAERNDFLQKFYLYVTDPNGYKARSWSSWRELNAN